MKKLIFTLLLIVPFALSAQSDASLITEIDSLLTNTSHNNNARYFNRVLKRIVTAKPNITTFGTLAFLNAISPTANITGWPANPGSTRFLQIDASNTYSWVAGGGGGITNSAPNNHIMLSDGTNAIDAGIIESGFSGSLTLGASAGVWRLSGGLYVAPSAFPSTGATGLFQTNQVNATTNTVMWPGAFSRGLTSGTAAVGIGTGIELITVNASGTYKTGLTIESISTNVTAGSEAFDFVIKNLSPGVGLLETFRITSNGALGVSGSFGTSGQILKSNGSGSAPTWQTLVSPSYTTITTTGNWSNLGSTAAYYKDNLGITHLKGAISITSANFPGVGTVTATSAIPNASNSGFYSVPVFRANGSYYVGSASVSISSTGQLSIHGFVTTASASSTGSAGVNVTLSGSDDIVVYLDGISYL